MILMQVIYQDIEGYEGLYQVSNLGDIKALPRRVYTKEGRFRRLTKERLLKKYKQRYLKTRLTDKNGIDKCHGIHRLVAKAFIPNPENKPHINHINCARHCNATWNLEWVTPKENSAHAVKNGLMVLSDETKKRMSEARKGNIPWNKGKRQKPLTHGTMYVYNQGCKCDKCKSENTRYYKAKRESKAKELGR